MGMFSWITQDSDRSIANQYSGRSTFTVYMYDDKGNKWKENDYEGYGVFGGKDYYELLSEMNGGPSDRSIGIDMAYSGDNDIKYPNLAESPNWKWRNEKPENCRYQGYFYGSGDEDEDDNY